MTFSTVFGEASLTDISQIGELQSVDGYMNIALEKTEEFVGGQLKHKYGDVFIRGNNGKMQYNVSPL